jgi:hypothetical protein
MSIFEFSSIRQLEEQDETNGVTRIPLPKRFVVNFHFIGWENVSLGFHICLTEPNIEFHVPFGFLRIGWTACPPDNWEEYIIKHENGGN